MTTHSPELQWKLIKRSSSFLVRRKNGKPATFTTVGEGRLVLSIRDAASLAPRRNPTTSRPGTLTSTAL